MKHFRVLWCALLNVTSTFSLPQLIVPVIANNTNHLAWPGVVSRDVMQHIGGLKGEVFTFSGEVKGKTLLPLPPQADLVAKAADCQARYWMRQHTKCCAVGRSSLALTCYMLYLYCMQ